MTKTILLLTAVVGLASSIYAADPSPGASASPGKKKTAHHARHHKSASPSASPSATP